jgi:hypothetical protein
MRNTLNKPNRTVNKSQTNKTPNINYGNANSSKQLEPPFEVHKSKDIDSPPELKIHKILLLGAGDSGKSRLFK